MLYFLRRGLAALVDALIALVLSGVLLVAAFVVEWLLDRGRFADDFSALNTGLMVGLLPATGFAYSTALEALTATTAGKWLLQLRVRGGGGPIGWAQAAARNASKPLSVASAGIGVVMPFFMPGRQAMHDVIAGTFVVVRSDAAPLTIAPSRHQELAPSSRPGPLISDDGRWWWDGTAWRQRQIALTPAPAPPMSITQRMRSVAVLTLVLAALACVIWGVASDSAAWVGAGVAVFLAPLVVLAPWLGRWRREQRARTWAIVRDTLAPVLEPQERLVAMAYANEGIRPWIVGLFAGALVENYALPRVALVVTDRRLIVAAAAVFGNRPESLKLAAPLSELAVETWSRGVFRPRLVLSSRAGWRTQFTFLGGWRRDAEAVRRAIEHRGVLPVA